MAEEEKPASKLPPAAQRDSRIFMLLLAASVLLYLMSIPLAFGVIVTGPVAAVFGLLALFRSRSAKGVATFRYAMVAGVLVSGFAALMGLALLVFRGPVEDLQTCLSRAITSSAEEACQREYQDAVDSRTDDLLERIGLTRP